MHPSDASDRDAGIRDTRGRIIVGNLENIRLALAQLGVTLGYDAFARELRVNGAPLVDDIAFEQLWTRIADTCGWQPSRRQPADRHRLRRAGAGDASRARLSRPA